MCTSILKRSCSTFLVFIMLTSSLTTQGFSMENLRGASPKHGVSAGQLNLSPAVQNLRTKLKHRTNTYNTQPGQPSIPRDTSEINRIYQSTPSDRHANDDEREAVIKGLMFTAGIHGSAMPLNVSDQIPSGSTLSALQKHYAIIQAVDVLSRDYFMEDMFSSREGQYALLQNYAGLAKTTINNWLSYTRQELSVGRALSDGKFWWDQKKCDAALKGENAAEVVEVKSAAPDQQPRVYAPVTREEATQAFGGNDAMARFFLELLNAKTKMGFNVFKNEIGRLTIKFIRPNTARTEVEDIIYSILRIVYDNNKCKQIIGIVDQFIGKGMGTEGVGQTIFLLTRITKDREEIVELTNQLIKQNMSGYEVNQIISSLSSLKFFRAIKLARALLFMRNTNPEIWRQVLETKITNPVRVGPMQVVAQGKNPYAVGINVHAGKRDQATISGARTLYENWLPSPKDIDREFNDFMHAVQLLEEPKKSKVLRSLGIDENGLVLPKPVSENFAGLLHGVDEKGNFILSSRGSRIKLNGRELIARFWHFANTYQDPLMAPNSSAVEAERAAMRAGVMNALAEGVVPRHNILRCEMGRVQLLELATLQGRLRGIDGNVVDVDDLGLNPNDVAVAAANAPEIEAPEVPQEAPRIRNLNEIAHYLQPFIDSLGPDITTAEQFYMRLFKYRNNLAAGHVMARGERIDLDPSEVVYFVRMMEPITERGKIVRYDINPSKSIIALLGFDDFKVIDYGRQFGDRDRARLEDARRIEAERALREQQDREYAAALEADRMKDKQRVPATEIQRITRGKLARNSVQTMKAKAEAEAHAQAELDQRVETLRKAIQDGTAGNIDGDAEVLSKLSDVEKAKYTRLRRVDRFHPTISESKRSTEGG